MTESWGEGDQVVGGDNWGSGDTVVGGAAYSPKYMGPAFGRGPLPPMTPQEHLLDSTSIGRILSAFGEGAEHGWGAAGDQYGLDDESKKALDDMKLTAFYDDQQMGIGKAFNQALLQPAAIAIDTALRAYPTAVRSLSEGVGQIGVETGLLKDTKSFDADSKARFVDSMDEFFQIGGIVAGGEGAYMGTRPNISRTKTAVSNFKEITTETAKKPDPLVPPEAPGALIEIAPPVEPGMVRMYHGGVNPRSGGARDVTPHKDYAKGYAQHNSGDSSQVFYVDVPKDAPFLKKSDYFEEDGIVFNQTFPEELIAQAKPLYKDVAETKLAATPAQEKLAAPLPPVTSPGRFTGKAGNINLDKINAPEDVLGVIAETADSMAGDTLATRGVVTWAETEQLAQAAGVDTSVLLKRSIGDAWNAHQIEAARNLLIESANNVIEVGQKARQTGADADMIAAREAWLRHSLIQEQVTGITAEAGRALNILRKSVGDAKAARVNSLDQVLKDIGGRAGVEDLLDALAGIDDPIKASRLIRDSNKPGFLDMVLEYGYNAMLSNPKTHAANAIGNTLAQFWRVTETGVAGVIGSTRAALGSKSARAGDRVYMGEAGAKLYGMFQGFPEGLRAAWRAIKTETPTNATKLELEKFKAIPTPLGRAVRVPGTALMAADEVFKAMGYRASLQAQAYRKAAAKKLKGDAFANEIARLIDNPTPKMMEAAKLEADYVTFTKELGKTGKAMQQMLQQHPVLKIVIAPFFRTPVDLLKFSGERTVFSIASKEVQAILMGKKGAAARDEQYAKLLLGSGVMFAAVKLVGDERMTGAGPKDTAERALWLKSGKQPYSVRIGETWYSYARLEPFATLLGIAADGAEISHKLNMDESAGFGTLITHAASQNILNKTWLKGLTDIIEAVEDPERYGQRYVQNLATRVVPTGLSEIARQQDPYLRDARNMLDAFKAKLPGYSDEVAPLRDIFGNALKREGSFGPDAVSPIFTTTVSKDPVVAELNALEIFPAKLDRKIRGVELDAKQYDLYQRVAGKLLYTNLKQTITMPGWQNVPAFVRMNIIDRQINKAREKARTYMLVKDPTLFKDAIAQKRKHMLGEK